MANVTRKHSAAEFKKSSPGRFPDLINDDEKLPESSSGVPTECLGEVAGTVRAKGPA